MQQWPKWPSGRDTILKPHWYCHSYWYWYWYWHWYWYWLQLGLHIYYSDQSDQVVGTQFWNRIGILPRLVAFHAIPHLFQSQKHTFLKIFIPSCFKHEFDILNTINISYMNLSETKVKSLSTPKVQAACSPIWICHSNISSFECADCRCFSSLVIQTENIHMHQGHAPGPGRQIAEL